jgi:hypothetical protein
LAYWKFSEATHHKIGSFASKTAARQTQTWHQESTQNASILMSVMVSFAPVVASCVLSLSDNRVLSR